MTFGATPTAAATASGVDGMIDVSVGAGASVSLSQLLWVIAYIVLAFAFGRVVEGLLHTLWRFGLDADRRWAHGAGILRLGVNGIAVFLIVRLTWRNAPTLTSLTLVVLVAGGLVASGYASNALVGFGLTLRRRIQVGDRVYVAGHTGVVRGVGLTRLHLRDADGATLLVPNRLLNEHAVKIERAHNSVPVRVRVTLDGAPTPALLERLRRAALLSPYRAPSTPVELHRSETDSAVEVVIQSWSEHARRDAMSHLEAALLDAQRPAG